MTLDAREARSAQLVQQGGVRVDGEAPGAQRTAGPEAGVVIAQSRVEAASGAESASRAIVLQVLHE